MCHPSQRFTLLPPRYVPVFVFCDRVSFGGGRNRWLVIGAPRLLTSHQDFFQSIELSLVFLWNVCFKLYDIGKFPLYRWHIAQILRS